jgi:hypothetical protein
MALDATLSRWGIMTPRSCDDDGELSFDQIKPRRMVLSNFFPKNILSHYNNVSV